MFHKSRRKSLRRKGWVFGLVTTFWFLPRWRCWGTVVQELQRLEHYPDSFEFLLTDGRLLATRGRPVRSGLSSPGNSLGTWLRRVFSDDFRVRQSFPQRRNIGGIESRICNVQFRERHHLFQMLDGVAADRRSAEIPEGGLPVS